MREMRVIGHVDGWEWNGPGGRERGEGGRSGVWELNTVYENHTVVDKWQVGQ
jgi:hypothetical protein